jgi:hypothetical protein
MRAAVCATGDRRRAWWSDASSLPFPESRHTGMHQRNYRLQGPTGFLTAELPTVSLVSGTRRTCPSTRWRWRMIGRRGLPMRPRQRPLIGRPSPVSPFAQVSAENRDSKLPRPVSTAPVATEADAILNFIRRVLRRSCLPSTWRSAGMRCVGQAVRYAPFRHATCEW